MKIISNKKAGQYHHYARNEKVRSLSSRFLLSHLPLDQEWTENARAWVQELATPHPYKRQCDPGHIGTSTTSASKEAMKRAGARCLATLGLETQIRNMRDGQTVLCLGASFHDDLHGWTNELFLNWYLAGPPRDFVSVGVGRVTIKPGDVMLFDPARAHGLLRPGERVIQEEEWGRAPEDHSFFLSIDLSLTKRLDDVFGIRRGAASRFEKAGSKEVDWNTLRVDEKTGRLRKAPQ